MAYYIERGDMELAYGRYRKGAKARKNQFLSSKLSNSPYKCACGYTMAEHIWKFQKENRKGGPKCIKCDRKKEAKEEGISQKNEMLFKKK